MAAVFDEVLDHAEIQQRVAASQSKLRAAAYGERARNTQMLQVLERVEKTLVHNQRCIDSLEDSHDRTLEAFRTLRDLLRDRQMGPLRQLRRCLFRRSYAARADLIARLDGLIAAMTEGGETPGEDAAMERDTATPRGRRGGVAKVLIFVLALPAKALAAVLGFLGSLIAEALVARTASSGLPLHLVRRKRAKLWAGGADARPV